MKDLIAALQIFLKYGDVSRPTLCEHDVLYVLVDPSVVSEGDRRLLVDFGFYADLPNENFWSFRYGSA